jgi:hypothetical protein
MHPGLNQVQRRLSKALPVFQENSSLTLLTVNLKKYQIDILRGDSDLWLIR